MKISATILVIFSALLCIHAASLEVVSYNDENGNEVRIGVVDPDDLVKMQTQNVTTTKEETDHKCPDTLPTSPDAPLNERAVCPWYLKVNRDENRMPVVIEEAVCRCTSCLERGKCVPNYADVPTLKKSPEGGYKLEALKVAVACNCIVDQS